MADLATYNVEHLQIPCHILDVLFTFFDFLSRFTTHLPKSSSKIYAILRSDSQPYSWFIPTPFSSPLFAISPSDQPVFSLYVSLQSLAVLTKSSDRQIGRLPDCET